MPQPPGARWNRTTRPFALGLLLLLAACGSTVPLQQAREASLDAQGGEALGAEGETSAVEGVGGTAGTAGDSAGGATLTGGAGGTGSGGTATGGQSGTSGTRSRPGGGSSSSKAAQTRGVSSTAIRIGVEYAANAGAVVTAFGGRGTSSGDWKVEFGMVIDDLNERGGILGRKIEPVWQAYHFDGDQWQSQEQAACTKFTQDTKVFAVIAFAHSDNGLTCYERAGLIQIVTGAFALFDEQTFRTYPHLVQAGGFTLDRQATAMVDNLAKQGFFADNAVIGLVSHKEPSWQRAAKVLERRLGTYGRSVAYTMELPEFHTAGDGQQFSQKMQTEMANMKDAGVDHVLFLQQTVTGALLFMNAAEPQQWRPRYGLTTNDSPDTLAANNVSPLQLRRSMGVGFSPSKDVPLAEDPGTPGLKRCADIFAKNGVTWSNNGAKSQSLQRCDHVMALAEAIKAGGEPISVESAMAGFGRLGTSMAFSTTFASDYRNGRRDGAAVMRGFHYVVECSCFRYNTGPITVD